MFFFWVLYFFLFGFMYIFKCFWSQTSQGKRGRPIPPPFLEREFSNLSRLKTYSRDSARLPVTFDQNGQNAISAEFGILAVGLPDWWFLRTKGVIGTFSQTVRAGIF